jgi:hypothetical protein
MSLATTINELGLWIPAVIMNELGVMAGYDQVGLLL